MSTEIGSLPKVESKELPGGKFFSRKTFIVLLAGIGVLFNFYYLGYGVITSYQMKGIFMVISFTLVYLLNMPRNKMNRIFHTLTLVMALTGPVWLMIFEDKLVANFYMATQAEVYVFLWVLVGLTALIMRTAGGLVIVIMMLLAAVYMFFGHYIPGAYGHGFLPPKWVTSTLFTSINSGMFGNLTEMAGRLISIFMIFASLLLVSGLGDFFIAIAQGLFGGMTGGPAKIAVVGSALFGTISGSAVSNVTATGSFTIPLMKKVGYTPMAAASIESIASIGGSLMPPIMGLGAFIMAEITGVPYFRICILAIIPSLLWYYSAYLTVHYTALQERVQKWRPPMAETKQVIKETWHVGLSIPILVAAMYYFTEAQVGAYWATIALVGLTFFRKRTRLNGAKIIEFLNTYARIFAPVFLVMVALDTFLGALLGTGIHLKIGNLIIGGISQWWLALIVVFAMCIVMGMVAPHTATYLGVVAVAAPALVWAFNFDLVQVHLFVFYGGLLAGLTPPVCVPVFVAASIAGSPLMRTGLFTAIRSLVLWIIPFKILKESLFFGVGTPLSTLALGIGTLLVGIFIFAVGAAGYFRGDLSWTERLIAAAIGVVIIQPFYTNETILIVSYFAGVAFIGYRIWAGSRKKAQTQTQPT